MASGEVATVSSALRRSCRAASSSRPAAGSPASPSPASCRCTYPFPVKDLVVLDDALKYGSRAAKARFAVYIGDLGADTAATAREILAKVPTPNNAVLLAVSPNQKAIEVVYGSDVQGRGIEESAPLGVSAAAASFKEGNLMDGLISAVRVLSAGVSPP